jgi:hypothetical protein
MEFWPQARPLALTGRSLRHGARHYDSERIGVECLIELRITSRHVHNQNTLGPAPACIDGRACLSLGSDRVDGLAPCFPAPTWARLVRDRALADLSAARSLHLVVQVRRLRAEDIPPGRRHRREWRDCGHGYRDHPLGLASKRSAARHDVWVGALG